ncbi:MAG: YdiU family protein [Nitrosomonadales bacterium]
MHNSSSTIAICGKWRGFYAFCEPERVPAPNWIKFNHSLAEELGLTVRDFATPEGANIFSGNVLPSGAASIAQVYAGHQFGSFSPQLGDGRALLLGEVIDQMGQRRDIQLKGSGRTPFSRNGDGKAATGPMLREYLMGEAMHYLGIPTTRALAVVATGERVRRDTLLPGAVLTRVAASHIRIGTFEYFASLGEVEYVRRLADYTIRRHYPELIGQPCIKFLLGVMERQAQLVASWMSVGFIHGVMNTDNVALSGETIDYGPCAFLENYDPATVFSSIDHGGRYAFGNQPMIAQWNLARFAETLLPLLDKDAKRAAQLATEAINMFPEQYETAWLAMMRCKMGLERAEDGDVKLAHEFLDALQAGQADYTLAWRYLADAAELNPSRLRSVFRGNIKKLDEWLPRWLARLEMENKSTAEVAAEMRLVNPYLIPRNHLVEQALEAASLNSDLGPFDQLLEALSDPYTERESVWLYAQPASFEQTASYQTFCGT